MNQKGPNAFYESVENRKACCFIRKVEPLKRALTGQKVWVTGIRAEHSDNRSQLNLLEWDEGNQLNKYNPLLALEAGRSETDIFPITMCPIIFYMIVVL